MGGVPCLNSSIISVFSNLYHLADFSLNDVFPSLAFVSRNADGVGLLAGPLALVDEHFFGILVQQISIIF